MSNIDLLKESNENIPASSIVSLLSDIIIKNLNDVSEFNETRKYYKGDRVHKIDETIEHGDCRTHHGIYECIADTTTGEWKRSDWVELQLMLDKSKKMMTRQITDIELSPLVATEDNQYFLTFSSNVHEENAGYLLFHPQKGIIDRRDYVIYQKVTSDKTYDKAIKLLNWNLKSQDYVILLTFSFGETNDGYDVVYEFTEKVDTDSEFVPFIDYVQGVDKVIIIHNKKGILKESEYAIDTSVKRVYLNGFTMKAGEYLSYIKFSKRKVKGFCDIVQKNVKVYSDSNKLRIPLSSYLNGSDKFILFKKDTGYIPISNYTIAPNSNYITFKDKVNYPKANNEYIFVIFSSNPINYIDDNSIDGGKLNEELKLQLFPLRGNVNLSQEKTSETITLPKGRFIGNNYVVTTEIVSTTGDVGTISITNKNETSFTITMSGIAKSVSIDYAIVSK